MALRLYNTLTKRIEDFKPLKEGHVGLYVCGPTVYDRAHLGNARPYVIMDVFTRLLRLSQTVTYVRNITDIDDKIMAAAQTSRRPIDEITTETTRYFHEDMEALGNVPPTLEPRATAHVPEMIEMIETLISKGHAYEADGHVLFDISSFKAYGKLSNKKMDEMIAGARVEVAPYKRNPADFVLWKPSTSGQPGWESPWGRGRPGWHIECSAMSLKHLGETFDIHAGGQDLIFPHHENEIAQTQGACGLHTFARHWLHNGILMVNGEKMSKSLGNFLTVEELLRKADGETIRFVLLSTHYRQPLDFTEEALRQAKAALDGLYTALETCPLSEEGMICADLITALEDDLNTPKAISRLHELAREINKEEDPKTKSALQTMLRKSGGLLGLLQKEAKEWFQGAPAQGLTADGIEALIEERARARKEKDFARADAIRQELEAHGVTLLDGAGGTTWRRV